MTASHRGGRAPQFRAIPGWRLVRSGYFGAMAGAIPDKSRQVDVFERDVVRLADQLRGFIRARISSPADAEDVAQEVFLKAFRARGALRDPAKLNAWLYRTARSAIIDHYRKRRPTVEVPANLAAEAGPPDEVAHRLHRSLRRFMATMPEACRRPLELAEVEGLTARAVATRLGLTETAAKSRIARARAMLRKKLTQCCRFEFDRFGKILDFKQRAPCGCGDGSTGAARGWGP
jgi:RNA polymerase sigma-70 factor (ECF subfamily)